MQTFLPYADFAESAKCLDNKRLNKQLVETQQILKALSNPLYGWQNHPAVKMWRGYEFMLCSYGISFYNEYKRRFNDKDHKSGEFILKFVNGLPCGHLPVPAWLGNEQFHASHRSNLLRKDSVWYEKFNWSEPNDLPYVWPV